MTHTSPVPTERPHCNSSGTSRASRSSSTESLCCRPLPERWRRLHRLSLRRLPTRVLGPVAPAEIFCHTPMPLAQPMLCHLRASARVAGDRETKRPRTLRACTGSIGRTDRQVPKARTGDVADEVLGAGVWEGEGDGCGATCHRHDGGRTEPLIGEFHLEGHCGDGPRFPRRARPGHGYARGPR